MKIETRLLGFVWGETGNKPEKINTVQDNYHGTLRLSIFHALVSHFKNKNVKMHKERRSKEWRSVAEEPQKIN